MILHLPYVQGLVALLTILPVLAAIFGSEQGDSEEVSASEEDADPTDVAPPVDDDAYEKRLDDIGSRLAEEADHARDVPAAYEVVSLNGNRGDNDLTLANIEQWRESGVLTDQSLRGADLSAADLTDANLHRAQLPLVNLSGATLRRVLFTDAVLTGATFNDADLRDSFLENADCQFATFTGADLSGAVLSRANLHHAHITEDQLRQANNLRGAIMPDGNIYCGQFELSGDLALASFGGVDLQDAEAMADFYGVPLIAFEAALTESPSGGLRVPESVKRLISYLEGRLDRDQPDAEPAEAMPAPELVDHEIDPEIEKWVGTQIKVCPTCGHTAFNSAVVCNHCGYNFELDVRIPNQSAATGLAGLLGDRPEILVVSAVGVALMILLLIVAGFVSMIRHDNRVKQELNTVALDDVWLAAQDYVDTHVHRIDSAATKITFPCCAADYVKQDEGDPDRYTVDSQVSYTAGNGSKINLDFHAVIRHRGDGDWHLVALQIE